MVLMSSPAAIIMKRCMGAGVMTLYMDMVVMIRSTVNRAMTHSMAEREMIY